jgi:hypothetical protein
MRRPVSSTSFYDTGSRQLCEGLFQVRAFTILGADSYAKACLKYELLRYWEQTVMRSSVSSTSFYDTGSRQLCEGLSQVRAFTILEADSYAKACLKYELLRYWEQTAMRRPVSSTSFYDTGSRQLCKTLSQVRAFTILGVDSYGNACLKYELLRYWE